MKLSQNPFSLYDFLGYFIPGSLLIFVVTFFQTDFDGSNVFDALEKMTLSNPNAYIPFILFSYVIGHLISFISSYTIERYGLWKYSYPSKYLLNIPHDGYYGFVCSNKYTKKEKVKTFILRTITSIILFPITSFDFLLGTLFKLGYLQNRKLDNTLIELIKDNLQVIYREIKNDKDKEYSLNLSKEDFFTLIYHYTLEKSNNHISKINNYVALYGFTRSIALVMVIVFWYTIFQFISKNHFDKHIFYCLGSIGLVCYFFFLSFLKFYKRYSLEILMTATILDVNQNADKKTEE